MSNYCAKICACIIMLVGIVSIGIITLLPAGVPESIIPRYELSDDFSVASFAEVDKLADLGPVDLVPVKNMYPDYLTPESKDDSLSIIQGYDEKLLRKIEEVDEIEGLPQKYEKAVAGVEYGKEYDEVYAKDEEDVEYDEEYAKDEENVEYAKDEGNGFNYTDLIEEIQIIDSIMHTNNNDDSLDLQVAMTSNDKTSDIDNDHVINVMVYENE